MVSRIQTGRRVTMPRLDDIAFARFLDDDDGRPVVILNLLRFEPDGGLRARADRLAAIRPELNRYGAEVVYMGEGCNALWEDDTSPWDAVAIVQYPSRRAFADMVEASGFYETPNALRDASVLEVVLRPIRIVN